MWVSWITIGRSQKPCELLKNKKDNFFLPIIPICSVNDCLIHDLEFTVPADGVKGKTWGPSSNPGGVVGVPGPKVKVRQPIVDETGQNHRWSKSGSPQPGLAGQ